MGSTISKKMAETPTEYSTPKLTGSSRKLGRKLLGSRTLLDRRYTPYCKTPKSARILSIPSPGENNRNKTTSSRDQATDNNNGGSDLASGDEVKNLVGKTWRVYSASPLYNFKYNAASLKSYAMSLSVYLEAETEVGNVLLSDSNSGKFKVEFKSIKELTMNDSDSPAVQITITPKQNGRKSAINPILTAVFCSLGNEAFKDAEPKIRENFTSLPVCLVKGPAALTRCFISGLEAQFDFKISTMTFSSLDLGWFVSLWVGVVLQKYSRPVEMCYCLPASTKGLSKILYSVKAKDAKAIWDCVHERGSPIFTEEESVTFIKALETHFYHHFKVDLSRIPLSRVGTSIVLVGSEGRIKLLHPNYVKHILQQITQSALVNQA